MRIQKRWWAFVAALAVYSTADARISVFLKPDPKAPLFKEVPEGDLMQPKAVEDVALADKGWHTAKVAISQVGFTEQANVMKELSLKPGAKVHVRPMADSGLVATTTGQEMVKVVKPGPWTQVTLIKPLTVYFLLGDEPALELVEPVEAVVPVSALQEPGNPELVVVAAPEVPKPAARPAPAPPEAEPSAPPPVAVQPTPAPEPPAPEPVPPAPTTIINETVSAAATASSPPATISEFDLLETVDPSIVRQSVAPVSSALLEAIQELDPLEVREGSNLPHTAPQLPVEIKPTVSISRQFEGRLIYKKPFFRRPGVRASKNAPPSNYQLVDANGKRVAYVRVDDIKVGSILKYVNKDIILSGPLEENPKGDEPIIQGRTIRLNLE